MTTESKSRELIRCSFSYASKNWSVDANIKSLTSPWIKLMLFSVTSFVLHQFPVVFKTARYGDEYEL